MLGTVLSWGVRRTDGYKFAELFEAVEVMQDHELDHVILGVPGEVGGLAEEFRGGKNVAKGEGHVCEC